MFSHISFGSLLLILLIVMMLFGTKRLREMGSDLGAAVRSFREGLQGHEPSSPSNQAPKSEQSQD